MSYSDFTLLFAFFAVMFATSQTDKGKAQQVLRFGEKSSGRGVPQGVEEKPQGKVVELLPSLAVLTRELSEEIKSGKMQIHMGPRGLTISFAQATLFPSGEDDIARDFYPSVQKIANAMKQVPNPARAEGHTDSVPIHNSRFRSNWELSAARSIALTELLIQFGVPRETALPGPDTQRQPH